jgi:dihydrofolate synthase/folylpolyglutamate synthase
MPNHCEAAAQMLALPKFGSGIGLHRMLWAIDNLEQQTWLSNLDAIRVTGSKGKGSTSAVCASILAALGIKVGLYTSPHLLRFNERIKLSGADITDDELTRSWEWFSGVAASYRNKYPDDLYGSFEAFTAVALNAFARNGLSTIVAEGGIGGRYDSTRVIPGKTVALTSVELEHTELLGSTCELIAYDKADLCPSDGTVVVGPVDRDVLRRLRGYCRVRNVSLIDAVAESTVTGLRFAHRHMEFSLNCAGIDIGEVCTPLLGEHQAGNIAVAITAAWNWITRNRSDISEEMFRRCVIDALGTIQWPGRLEFINENPEVLIDVGHTPQSMRMVASTVKKLFGSRPILLLTGVSRDKNVAGILSELIPVAAVVVCTRAYHKGASSDELGQLCRGLEPGIEVLSIEPLEEAAQVALARAASAHMPLLVAGGLFLAVEVMTAMRGGDPRLLHFA